MVHIYIFPIIPVMFFITFWILGWYIFTVNNFYLSITFDKFIILVSGVKPSDSTLYNLLRYFPDVSSTHLTQHIVATIALTVFPML